MKKSFKRFNNKNIINIVITLVASLIIFYLFLPPLNISAPAFWTFVFVVFGIYLFLSFVNLVDFASGHGNISTLKLSLPFKIMLSIIPVGIILIMLVNFVLSPLFNSNSYASRIAINEGKNFTSEVKEVDFSRVPLLDKLSTQKIGDRVMGEMTDLVSQFTVSDLYTQINYNDTIVRVTPLEYASIIKYFTNKSKGITGYIVVNSVDGKASLVRLEEGMKYMPSAMFNENLYRKLRFSYPTEIFGTANFELDEEGNPFWIVPTIRYSGVGLKEEIDGVVVLDPITGDSEKYDVEEIPTWVDHVYSADLILKQVNDWGLYNGGYWNSVFGQKNVVATTTGYNYVAQDDDIYLYTGITSVASDESNLGFILTNLRTKETNYYLIPGAEEYSAMASAEGQVQQMKYSATFPLLINLNGKATYLISLKDNAGLVKMYAFVDVENYQKVVVTDANEGILKARDNYLKNSGVTGGASDKVIDITIKNVYTAIIDGNTYYYLVDNQDKRYRVSISVNESILPFLKAGDKVKIKFVESVSISEIYELEM